MLRYFSLPSYLSFDWISIRGESKRKIDWIIFILNEVLFNLRTSETYRRFIFSFFFVLCVMRHPKIYIYHKNENEKEENENGKRQKMKQKTKK